MNRSLLIKASIRFIPVALLSMLCCFLMVGTIGALIGNGFGNSILYIAFPSMAGGIGAGLYHYQVFTPIVWVLHQEVLFLN